MSELSCEELLQYIPSISDFKDLRSSYIVNCVLNNFLTHTAIVSNIVTMLAIRKSSSLPNTSKTLLLSLAASDIGVGFFVQPFYTSLLVNWLQQNNPNCYAYVIFRNIGFLFSTSSFLSVVAVSVDRFLAVHLHLRYQEFVTHKRVVVVVIIIWLLSATVPLLTLWNLHDVQRLILSLFGITGILLTTLIYMRIYLVVRRHKIHIQSLRVLQSGEMANFSGLINSAVGVFYIYVLLIICCLPFLICLGTLGPNNSSTSMKKLFV